MSKYFVSSKVRSHNIVILTDVMDQQHPSQVPQPCIGDAMHPALQNYLVYKTQHFPEWPIAGSLIRI